METTILTRILLCLTIINLYLVNGLNESGYHFDTFKHNTGLYYEQLNDIRVYHAQWRLITSLNLGRLLAGQRFTMEKQLSKVDT